MAPLPLVPQEIEGVAENQASNVYLNKAFTPEVLSSLRRVPVFRRVHVATHAEFLPGGPSQSRLHTGTGPVIAAGIFAGFALRRRFQLGPVQLECLPHGAW